MEGARKDKCPAERGAHPWEWPWGDPRDYLASPSPQRRSREGAGTVHSLSEQVAAAGPLGGRCSVSLPLRCFPPPPRPGLTFRGGRASFQEVASVW